MKAVVQNSVSRRAALTGIGAGGIGAALVLGATSSSAQDSSMADHPLVGTWIIDRNIATSEEVPTVVVFTANGSFIDAYQGVNGVWEATGPLSAAMTILPFTGPNEATIGYAVVRSTWQIDEGGDTMSGPANVTVVLPDGTVVAKDEFNSTAVRMKVEPMGNIGMPLAIFPIWVPAPVEGTPTS